MDTTPTVYDLDGRTFKYLSDNRELYILMSEMTRDGRVPTIKEVREEAARREHQTT